MSSPALTSPLKVIVYSDDRDVRAAVATALGRRPAPELPEVMLEEFATEPAVTRRLREGSVDLAILDGEAVPAGGMGVCRTLKEEVFDAPPVLLLLGRPGDAWLAAWSRADGVVSHPLDPVDLAEVASTLLRGRIAAVHT